MPRSTTEAREEHNKLFLTLSETFSPDSSNFAALQRAARAYLGQGTIEQCKNIEALAEKLQQAGVIKIGDYSKLKRMVQNAKCNVDEIIPEIEETENKIKTIEGGRNGAHFATQNPKPPNFDDVDAKIATRHKQIVMGHDRLADSPENSDTNPTGTLEKQRYPDGKGLCLILNFFSKEREATEYDVTSLKKFWESVGCLVIVEEDPTKEKVTEKLTECRADLNNPLSGRSYFICAILSHGDEKGILTNDKQTLPLTEIMDMFKNDKMEKFCGKPKIFLVQACQGKKKQAGHADHSDEEPVDIADVFPAKVPTDADILLACATTHGYKAFRRDNHGSWFIQELVDHLKRHHETEHLEEILISVRHRVGVHYSTLDGVKQMPCTWSTLTKRFYV